MNTCDYVDVVGDRCEFRGVFEVKPQSTSGAEGKPAHSCRRHVEQTISSILDLYMDIEHVTVEYADHDW